MRYFCTYFDSNYLVKGLALYRSLERHAAPFRLWVLALDDAAYRTLRDLALPNLHPVSLPELEASDPDLAAARPTRSLVEYYFTCTASLTLYILEGWPEVDAITYLDADLYFFGDPAPVEDEFAAGSVLIIGHRFPPAFRHLESRGIYNVGYVSFRRDVSGLDCLRWWRARCLEWCYDREEGERFADQKYLDKWPALFAGVVALQHPGGGLAPWNMANYRYTTGPRGEPEVDEQPLIFAHFHSLKPAERRLLDPGLKAYGVQSTGVLKRRIYGPYLAELWQTARWLQQHNGRAAAPGSVRNRPDSSPLRFGAWSRLARAVRGQAQLAASLVRGDRWLVLRGRVI